uniref:Uncharacterized protein n=1 Tax=Escherichia coli TaxID=562 RepID=A0A3G1E119_ECOLX|nr:hypothetical protein plasmid_0175 [Escherichia coli]UMW89359.1 hypothetical protein [Klebsiella pneumoniae]
MLSASNAAKQRHILRFERSEAKCVRWLGWLTPLPDLIAIIYI